MYLYTIFFTVNFMNKSSIRSVHKFVRIALYLFASKPLSFYAVGFKKLPDRWEKIVENDEMAEARRATVIILQPELKKPSIFSLETLTVIYNTFMTRWQKEYRIIKNRFHNGVYPSMPGNSIYMVGAVFTLSIFGIDSSFGIIDKIELIVRRYLHLPPPRDHIAAAFGFSICLWVTIAITRKKILQCLLVYHGWIYEVNTRKSIRTILWSCLLKMIKSNTEPTLFCYQKVLPRLPVPKLQDTIDKYLMSMKPLKSPEEFEQLKRLATEFQKKIGFRVQVLLYLKYWISPNYVSDWWEQFVYLSCRAPLVINSNYYGMDALFVSHHWLQPARAANLVCAAIQFMDLIKSEQIPPLIIMDLVPLCSSQYHRMFNTTRIPKLIRDSKGSDELREFPDSNHIVVIHKGRYFKCMFYVDDRKLEPVDMELILQSILDNKENPEGGEEYIPVLTAGERNHWASAREKYFTKGVNKKSLECIESAAFILILDESEEDFNPAISKHLDDMAHALIHGKGYDRWFDKTFNMVVFKNGRAGFNAEHSWADAPIMGHMWEYILMEDVLSRNYGYTPDGHCRGIAFHSLPMAERLKWHIPSGLLDTINISMKMVTEIINDLDLHIFVHHNYGKGFIKKCKVSPDAYIQLALQLTYYQLNKEFCQTYESSMTRLFRDGRTETVRSCTSETCEAVKSFYDNNIPISTKINYIRNASDKHQKLYRDAMTGKGVDRHLFCMYIICRYLNVDSEFLKRVLTNPWKLSTSQTPFGQTKQLNLNRYPNFISAGGGFGPVADDGYGVSYIVVGEDRIFFHISSKYSCEKTNSKKFAECLLQSLSDLKELFKKVL